MRHEVPHIQNVGRPDPVTELYRLGLWRGPELPPERHRDHRHLRRADTEPRHDRAPRVLGVRDDRRRPPGVQARERPGGDVVDGPAAARIPDEKEIVDRDDDRARRRERALVIRREEHRDPVAGEGTRQGHLVPPLRRGTAEDRVAHAGELGIGCGRGVAVHDARPPRPRGRAQDLGEVATDPGAHPGSELAAVHAEPPSTPHAVTGFQASDDHPSGSDAAAVEDLASEARHAAVARARARRA